MTSTNDSPVATEKPSIEVVSDFIRTIGSSYFFHDFGEVVGSIVPYDGLLFFLYRPDAAPILLSNTRLDDKFQQGLDNYLDHTYLLNPVYQAFKSTIPSGVYLMSEILPDGYGDLISAVEFEIKIDAIETIGYLTPGWPKHMVELMPLINLPDGSMVEITVLRKRKTGFSQREHNYMKQVFPVVSSVFHKHWELMNQDFSSHESRPSLDSCFHEFGAAILTDREKEVVKLVLTGHSSQSISLRLGISVPTIKSHRRNIYSKLEIGSQAELFSRFIGYLTSRPRY